MVNKLEKQLQKLAFYDPQITKLKPLDLSTLLDAYQLEFISKGTTSRVFRIDDLPWVVKEGRWDLDMSLFGDTKLSLPSEPVEKILNIFEMSFLPTQTEIIEQYKRYLTFAEYFGYFVDQKVYYHPHREQIFKKQQQIRDNLAFFCSLISKRYNLKNELQLKQILASPVKHTNFLPKEYLLYGKSISPENHNKDTYFLFQEYIKGKHLHDWKINQEDRLIAEQLVVLTVLILLMHLETGYVPDTRPRYMMIEAYDWLTKTDNIIIAKETVKFIDTRLIWNINDNIVKRGVFIPARTISLTVKYLDYLLDKL